MRLLKPIGGNIPNYAEYRNNKEKMMVYFISLLLFSFLPIFIAVVGAMFVATEYICKKDIKTG